MKIRTSSTCCHAEKRSNTWRSDCHCSFLELWCRRLETRKKSNPKRVGRSLWSVKHFQQILGKMCPLPAPPLPFAPTGTSISHGEVRSLSWPYSHHGTTQALRKKVAVFLVRSIKGFRSRSSRLEPHPIWLAIITLSSRRRCNAFAFLPNKTLIRRCFPSLGNKDPRQSIVSSIYFL